MPPPAGPHTEPAIPPRPRIGLPRRALFALLSTLAAFALLEGVLRVVTRGLGRASIPHAKVLAHVEGGAMEWDPVYGWVRAELPLPSEGIDENQFRTVTPRSQRPPRAGWRAFALGDSQTYGAGVSAREAWPAQAEALLAAGRPERPVEIINTGTSGYGSLQALRLIRHKLGDWSPDAYLVDCRVHDQSRDEAVPLDPRFPGVDRMLFHWRTWYVLRYAIEKSRGRLYGPHVVHDPSHPSFGADWTRAGNYGNHDLIVAAAEAQGAQVWFLDYPVWDRIHGGLRCLASAEDLPRGVAVIPVCAALQASGLAPEQLFFDNNHMRPAGNALAGEAVAAALLAAPSGP